MTTERLIIGWREWVHLPDIGVRWTKVKVDTGARTSALHAENIENYRRRGRDRVKFTVYPLQRSRLRPVRVDSELLEMRKVRSSNGSQEERPVIETDIDIGGTLWTIELTLTEREVMGFRMLLGRQGIRGHVLIDPGRSFLTRRRKTKPKSKPTQHR